MTGTKTHFRSYYQLDWKMLKWFMKFSADATKIFDDYRLKIFLPFFIPIPRFYKFSLEESVVRISYAFNFSNYLFDLGNII